MTALQVIRARIPLPQEPLATLCSSYTQQHNLDRSHLERRGIFASVLERDGNFYFLDPVRFVALLGTVTDIAFPLDLSKAFHQIGNAISVPHALICLLIMLSSITKQQLPIQECLRKCWLSRIHADVTVVLVEKDHVWVRNIVQFVHSLPKPSFHVVCPNAKVAFLDETFSIEVGKHQNFRELGAMLFRLPLRLMMQIRVEHFSLQPTPTDLVYDFLSSERECDIFLGGYLLCSIQACEPIPVQHTTENHLNLHGVPTFLQGTSLPFGPFGPEDLLFTQAIENLENLNCTTTYPGSTFVIWAGKDLWAFTPFDELDAATQMGEPVEFVELRVYLHDLLQPAHERDFRSLAVFPIMELMAAKVVVARADFQGNLIVETVVGPEWEEGGWTLWTLIWKGHMVLLQPPTDFDLTSWLAEERQSTPVLGFNFYWHARHDQPVSAPGKVACRLRKPPRRAGEGWLMSGLVRQHSSLAAVATSYNQMEGSSLAGATTTAGMTKEWIKEALQPVELFSDPPNPTVEEPYNQAYVTEEAEVTNTTEETLDHAYVTEKAEVAEDENQVFEAEGAGDQGFEAEEVNSSNMSWELSDQENGEQHEPG